MPFGIETRWNMREMEGKLKRMKTRASEQKKRESEREIFEFYEQYP